MSGYLLTVMGSDVDKFYVPENYPLEGDFTTANFVKMAVGGPPLNVGCVVSAKGVDVKALDYLSDETNSTTSFLLEELKKRNVDVSHIKIGKAVNGEVMIFNTGDKRTMFVINCQHPTYQIDEEMEKLLNEASYIYSLLHMYKSSFASLDVLRNAKKNGAKILIDGTGKYANKNDAVLTVELADGLFINKTDYNHLCDSYQQDVKKDMFANGCQFIVITDGSKGADLYTDTACYRADSLKLEEVVDSTGAGDSFAGAFIYGLMKGYDYLKCLRLASVSGAYACLNVGGLAAAVSENELVEFARKNNYQL